MLTVSATQQKQRTRWAREISQKKKKRRERDAFAEVTGGQVDADDEEIRDNVMKKQPIREGGGKRHSCLQLWKGHNRLVES